MNKHNHPALEFVTACIFGFVVTLILVVAHHTKDLKNLEERIDAIHGKKSVDEN